MDKAKNYINKYLSQVKEICDKINVDSIEKLIAGLQNLKKTQGRVVILGVGGSAANASHCVNDFRKILGIEAYAPTDNVAELTARINDESWVDCFVNWLKGSRLNSKDAILILSVGGGSVNASENILKAIQYANSVKAKTYSIVSRTGGYAKGYSDVCVMIPVVDHSLVTPHAEEWQGVVWHLLVNYKYEN
jgi:D-sedoheptulose 7-phosphate isomerase